MIYPSRGKVCCSVTTLPVMPQDSQLQETVPCGSDSFPIQYCVDDLSQWCQQSVPLHWHPYPEFFSVASGTVEVQVGSDRLTLAQGEAIFISGNLLHGYRQPAGTSTCLCPNILFSAQLIAPVSSSIYNQYLLPLLYNPEIPYVVFKPEVEWQQQILVTLTHLYTLLSKYGPAGYYPSNPDEFLPKHQVFSDCFELEVLQDLCHIFHLLYSNRDQLVQKELPRIEMIAQIRFKKMLAYIDRHFAEKVTLQTIASSANISRSEAGRCFQKYCSLSPVQYLMKRRIDHAKHLLRSTSLSVKEIAAQCDFQDSSYFIKAFRKHVQMTPLHYREAGPER